jgi:hypothetical protein
MDLLSKSLAQYRPKIANAIGKPELDCLLCGPEFTREQRLVGAVEFRPAAFLHKRYEMFVDVLLDRLDPFYVVRLFRQEGIQHRLAVTRGVKPSFDTDFLDELVEAERSSNNAD